MFPPLPVDQFETFEVPPPPLSVQQLRRFDQACDRFSGAVRFDGTAVRLERVALTGRRLQVFWYPTRYTHTVAVGRDPRSLPAGRRHRGMSFFVHLHCRDGWVVTRRSDEVLWDPGCWQPAAAEGFDPDDLRGGFDPAAAASRALFEELGLQLPLPGVEVRFRPQAAAVNDDHHLHLITELADVGVDDIRAARLGAPDRWETSEVQVLGPSLRGPWMTGLWLPADPRTNAAWPVPAGPGRSPA